MPAATLHPGRTSLLAQGHGLFLTATQTFTSPTVTELALNHHRPESPRHLKTLLCQALADIRCISSLESLRKGQEGGARPTLSAPVRTKGIPANRDAVLESLPTEFQPLPPCPPRSLLSHRPASRAPIDSGFHRRIVHYTLASFTPHSLNRPSSALLSRHLSLGDTPVLNAQWRGEYKPRVIISTTVFLPPPRKDSSEARCVDTHIPGSIDKKSLRFSRTFIRDDFGSFLKSILRQMVP